MLLSHLFVFTLGWFADHGHSHGGHSHGLGFAETNHGHGHSHGDKSHGHGHSHESQQNVSQQQIMHGKYYILAWYHTSMFGSKKMSSLKFLLSASDTCMILHLHVSFKESVKFRIYVVSSRCLTAGLGYFDTGDIWMHVFGLFFCCRQLVWFLVIDLWFGPRLQAVISVSGISPWLQLSSSTNNRIL